MTDLTTLWREEHTQVFLALKLVLLLEPILKAPQFDGTPFIVTSDGSKNGFGAVLTQRSTTVLPSGKTVSRTH
ncbi:hypothetical protein PAXINDRAFT_69609, partial [Paxillus involutus ATCC 200175]